MTATWQPINTVPQNETVFVYDKSSGVMYLARMESLVLVRLDGKEVMNPICWSSLPDPPIREGVDPAFPTGFMGALKSNLADKLARSYEHGPEDYDQGGITYRQWAAVHITAAFIAGETSWDDKAVAGHVLRLVDVLIEELERLEETP